MHEKPLPTTEDQRDSSTIVPTSSRRRYLLAARRGPSARMAGVQPMATSMMNGIISTLGVDVERRIRRGHGTVQTLSAGSTEATDVLVVRLEPERADLLRRTMPPNLMLAEDQPLQYVGSVRPLRSPPKLGLLSSNAPINTRRIRFRICGMEDVALEGATVQLTGDGFPAQGTTDSKGEVELELQTLGDQPARCLTVMTSNTYWDLYVPEPQLNESGLNIVRLRALNETVSGFPEQFKTGWGQRLMGLDQLPREMGGAGVKIAIIDSGCDNTHPLLRHIRLGRDFTGSSDANAWTQDILGHGSHCAGIIAARAADDKGMRGFAPDAEVHVLRVFPGGQYSNLLEALDYCIDQGIDVVNMSLGGDSEINPVVEETLQIAAMHGLACIVAAGNSGDAVKYPARSPNAFAVAAIGQLSELQPYTWDMTTVQSQLVSPDGLFSPSFSCFGPEVAVCAPGVGIISTVPGGAFEPQTGTSMAAPHVTGLAALLLAHHPAFSTRFKARTHERAAALFSLIRSMCVPSVFGSQRAGAGIPQLRPVISALQAKPVGVPEPITTGQARRWEDRVAGAVERPVTGDGEHRAVAPQFAQPFFSMPTIDRMPGDLSWYPNVGFGLAPFATGPGTTGIMNAPLAPSLGWALSGLLPGATYLNPSYWMR